MQVDYKWSDCRFEISDCRFKTLRGPQRGHKDRDQFVGFLQQRSDLLWMGCSAFNEKFQPEESFVCLFKNNSKFGNEIRRRSRAAYCSIVCADGSGGAQ